MSRKRQESQWNEEELSTDEGPTREEPEAGDEVAGDEDGNLIDDSEIGRMGPSLADLQQECAEWKERALRAAADLENFRRRSAVEAQNARKYANEGLIYDLLPVLDSFQRAVEAADKTQNFEALKSGVDLIQRQLDDVLKKVGLEVIPAVGEPFDPNVHQAVMQVEPEDGQPPHIVVDELRPGYKLNDRVLRPTLVKVTSG